jgi:hypothetical protein
MEFIVPVLLTISLLTVISIDTIQKRRVFLKNGSKG